MAEYTPEIEQLLKSYGEQFQSLALLHHFSYQKYSYLSAYTNIPVIVLSALLSVIINITLFDNQDILMAFISATIGIIKTIDSYFDYTKKSEQFKAVKLQYDSLFNLISINLSLERERRISYLEFINIITNQLDAIKKQEPPIDDDIIKKYNDKYKEDNKASKPPIVNGLSIIKINSNLSPTSPKSFIIENKNDNKIKIGLEI